MNQKILVFAGKKQSGKTSAANFITGYVLCQMGRRGYPYCPTNFIIDDDGHLIINSISFDNENINTSAEGVWLDLNRKDESFFIWANDVMWPYVKIYAFADSLKDIAVTVFGIEPRLVYGTDEDKNDYTHIKWSDMCRFLPPRIVSNLKRSEKYEKRMTGREFLQYFGTNICRELDDECWTRKCFNDIITDGSELAIIQDCRFANEVKASYKNKEKHNIDVKVIKLTRSVGFDIHESENGLKGISDDTYDLVVDNEYMTIKEKNQTILDALYSWKWFDTHVGIENS